jgi:hypothetical protein
LIEQGFGSLIAPFDFDLGALAFTPSMAKRAGSVFAAAPIVQGKWDGTGVPDKMTIWVGLVVNDFFLENSDPYQGTISFWITPEWDGGDGIRHEVLTTDNIGIYKSDTDRLSAYVWDGGGYPGVSVDVSGWTAGTSYHVTFRWDSKNSLDGTNYVCISVNGSHTFAVTDTIELRVPTNITLGGQTAQYGADAIIEGYRYDRRVWYEDTSGTGEPYYFDASGYIDEIAAAYDAGAGADPALVEASWDGCMCLPTDSAVGALTTGTGEAWSHPHASALLNNTWLEDGFGPNQQDVVTFNGSSTSLNVGSGATLDDLLLADCTIEVYVKIISGDWQPIFWKSSDGESDGWQLTIDPSNKVFFKANFATTDLIVNWGSGVITDSVWHHIAVVFDVATKSALIYIDGKVGSAGTAGVDAYQSDAAEALTFGANSISGDLGWVRLSDNKRYTANFKAPRTMPGADGNTIEQWAMDDGTGGTAVATVTSPGNDGTITDGTWTEKWEFTGTPLELTSLEFDGAATEVNFGSAASLDDLFLADFTYECWIQCDITATGSDIVIMKSTDIGSNGFYITANNGVLYMLINAATNNGSIAGTTDLRDGKFHHIAVTFTFATKAMVFWVDGVNDTAWTDVLVGAYQSDAAADLENELSFLGKRGWQRISDNIRYTDTFLPPTRVNPPADDGNTVSLWLFDEGAGTTAADTNANANHGTITMGAGQWWNTIAQEYDSPGSRTYAWGYSIGSDAPSDGVEQHIAVTAGDDWVLRIPVRYEDATAQAQILVYDETGAAAVSTFDGPPRTGLHSGGNGSATLIVANEVFPASLIDGTIYNITDGSSGTITAVGGTNQDTITGALSGGTDDDWDTNDVFMLMPPDNWVWCEPFCVEAPAGSTEMSVQLLNAAGDGVLLWQQAEVQTSLVSNGSLEAGAGNPWIPTDWTNADLDAGDTEAEAVIVHSGVGSMEWNIGASNEGVRIASLMTQAKFYTVGGWCYTAGGQMGIASYEGGRASLQPDVSGSSYLVILQDAAAWNHGAGVLRQDDAQSESIYLRAYPDATGDRYTDDIYLFQLDDVSLTVTPASEANSLEGTGIRIDGRDVATQVPDVGILQATQGWIRFRWRPRHSAAQAVAFGETGVTTDIFDGRAPIANYIALYWAAANTVQLIVFDGGVLGIVWNATGLVVADTEYLVEIKYYPARADLLIDGVIVATGAGGIDFGADIITLANYGHNNVNADQTDAVFSAP